jgi:hypothetical protein
MAITRNNTRPCGAPRIREETIPSTTRTRAPRYHQCLPMSRAYSSTVASAARATVFRRWSLGIRSCRHISSTSTGHPQVMTPHLIPDCAQGVPSSLLTVLRIAGSQVTESKWVRMVAPRRFDELMRRLEFVWNRDDEEAHALATKVIGSPATDGIHSPAAFACLRSERGEV